MKRTLLALLAVAAFVPDLGRALEPRATRYIIGFKPGVSTAERSRSLEGAGLQVAEELEALGLVVATPKIGALGAGLPLLAASPAVAGMTEDFYQIWINDGRPAAVFGEAKAHSLADVALPNMEVFLAKARGAGLTALPPAPSRSTGGGDLEEQPWGIRRVHAPEAWALGMLPGDGVRVAVIDTGIDNTHPELAAAVVGGYNARSGSRDAWRDDNGHGTHVAGTIAAARDGKGVVGVAPGVRLYAVKVLDKDGGGYLTDILKGIVWCGHNNIQVANMSLGASRGVTFMQWAVEYTAARGVTLVAAAGNGDGNGGPSGVGYPAAYKDAIAVSALAAPQEGKPEAITPWSSRGKQVAFIAPGENVRSSVPGGGYAEHDGTSMATPHVTGLAALAVARGARGPAAVRAMLTRAAVKVQGLSAEEQGAGVIDARKLAR